jgi:Zn-dependent M16 (insulinase) family peptidase
MKIEDIIQILENRVNNLVNTKGTAFAQGDLNTVVSTETEIMETQNTIEQLKKKAQTETPQV